MKKYKDKVNHFLTGIAVNEEYCVTKQWTQWEYKEITIDFYLNNSYKSLFWLREMNMSWPQKMRLRQILSEFDPHGYLTMAWVAKESFIEWLENYDIEQIREVRDDCLSSDHYMIKSFGQTLKRWDQELDNYCKYSTPEFNFTNAVTEALNNQCKVAKRVSMWFRHKNNYKRKLASRVYPNNLS